MIVADGGAYGSLWLTVDGGLQNTSCRLASSPQLAGAILTKESFHSVKVASIAEALPPGASLLHCDSDEFIEGHQVVEIDFLSFGTTGVSALGPGGDSVSPPRLCIRGISCSYFGGGDLDWMGDPECGDADYDDAIEAGDALRALRTAVGQPSCEPVPTVCDTNSDQQVTAADALGILRASIQLDVTLVCPPPCAP